MTNREKIMAMSDEELGEVLMCPYDLPIFPEVCGNQCDEPDKATFNDCRLCIAQWLKEEAK